MRFMKLDEVMERTGLGRSTIYAFMNDNMFPQGVKLGARSVGWVDTEINDWIEQKIAERDGAHTI